MPLSLAASEPQLFCEGVCLPDELFWHIFSFLDIPSMLAVGATCRSWRRFVGEVRVGARRSFGAVRAL